MNYNHLIEKEWAVSTVNNNHKKNSQGPTKDPTETAKKPNMNKPINQERSKSNKNLNLKSESNRQNSPSQIDCLIQPSNDSPLHHIIDHPIFKDNIV